MGRKLLILVSLITFAVSGFAQDGLRINGKVQDAATGEPLIGANVQIEGENIGAATDLEGRFTVTYQAQSAFNLIVGYVGYKTRTIALSPNGDVTNLHIEMEQDVFQGEEVVITGIGSRREKSIAEVAVSRLGMDDLSTVNSYQDFAQVVTGKVSGVNVESSSGNIGSGIRFNMRSGGGLNGDEQPVIYVDGIRIDNAEIEPFDIGGQGVAMLADLNPEDIRDIEILKGPAAAASYGTRGSNGVVFITTKRGRYAPGTPQPLSLDYKYVTGYNAPSYKYSEQDYLTYKSINNVFRNGPIQQHNLKATGGSSLIKYYVGVDWRNEFGIIPDNYMDRKNLRANFDVIPNENLVVNVSTNYTLNEIEHPHNDNDIYGFLGNTILAPVPYFSTDSTAILALENTTDINRFIGSVEAIYNPFANLELRLSAGMDDSDLRTDQVFPADFQYQYFPSGRRSVYTRQNTQNTYTIDGNYTYNLTHELQVNSSLGAQLFDRRTRTFFADNQDYLSELITNIGAGETLIDLDETLTHVKEAGIYTEHAFSLMNRYYFSMMLRRDFASAIGIEAPSIYYPRASLAVRLDRFKFTPAVFSLLKLRTAYGESGVLPQLTDGIPLLWEAEPSGYGAGAVLNAIGNSEIRPERLKEWEFGLEAEFTRRFSAEFTYYRQRSEDSIIEFRNAPSTGRTASAVPFNIGVIKGWGTEILLQARPFRTRNYQLDLTVTHSYQTNDVVDLGGAQPIFDGTDLNVIAEGLPKHAFYTWEVNGALFNEDGSYAEPDVAPERSYRGTPIPVQTGSFAVNLRFLKNFRLYVLTDAAIGHSIYNRSRLFSTYLGQTLGIGANNRRYRELEDRLGLAEWFEDIEAYEVGSADYQEAAHEYARMDFRFDDNFIEDADYFKIREISLSYDFSDWLPAHSGTSGISALVIGLSARNVFTATKYSGADVELNFDGARSLTRGQDFLTLMNPAVYNFFVRISL